MNCCETRDIGPPVRSASPRAFIISTFQRCMDRCPWSLIAANRRPPTGIALVSVTLALTCCMLMVRALRTGLVTSHITGVPSPVGPVRISPTGPNSITRYTNRTLSYDFWPIDDFDWLRYACNQALDIFPVPGRNDRSAPSNKSFVFIGIKSLNSLKGAGSRGHNVGIDMHSRYPSRIVG
jgi:hypothetical protein